MRHSLNVTFAVLLTALAGCTALTLTPAQERQLERVATEPPPPGETAFHVVGLHQGLAPPWYNENCADANEPRCQQMIRNQVEHEVKVTITATERPLILGLSAYERTHWELRLAPGVEIQRVILSGHHPQNLSGLGAAVPVEYYVDEDAPCPVERCLRTGSGFYDFQAPAQRYEELVSQPPTSFLGSHEQGWIEIGPNRAGVY